MHLPDCCLSLHVLHQSVISATNGILSHRGYHVKYFFSFSGNYYSKEKEPSLRGFPCFFLRRILLPEPKAHSNDLIPEDYMISSPSSCFHDRLN